MQQDVERILFSESELVDAVELLAGNLTEAYRGSDLTVVSVLKGSCVFAADLIRRLPIPMELGFAVAESYGDGTTSSELSVHHFPAREELDGRDVLLVDDILDSGRTLSALRTRVLARGAVSVRTCVLLDKPSRRSAEIEADFRCFEIDDLFVVGYGLDFAGRYRNLPYVAELRAEVLAGSLASGSGEAG